MATVAQHDAVRYDLDIDSDIMGDDEIDTLYDRATARYGGNDNAIDAHARVLAIGRLLSGASRRTDYIQNQSAEKLSKIFEQLLKLREVFRQDLTEAVANSADGEVMYGGLRRKPSRLVEIPNDTPYALPITGGSVSGFDHAEFE